MSVIKHAVIAAAGIGSRMGNDTPKTLIEIGGKPLIHHLLERLAPINDVRIVVGYKFEEVINAVLKVRKDVTFIKNPFYLDTGTLHSYMLGSKYIKNPCFYMDADIFFEPKSFTKFVQKAEHNQNESLIAITKIKTQDCVYSHLNSEGEVIYFSRQKPSAYEWANLCYLPNGVLEEDSCAVYEKLSAHFPLKAEIIESHEMDTVKDLENFKFAYKKRGCTR